VHGEIGQNLAVQFDIGQLEAVDKRAVGDSACTARCIDANGPQAPILAFLLLPSDKRLLVGTVNCIVSGTDEPATATAKPFRLLENALAALP
jgi:hypothetical protein